MRALLRNLRTSRYLKRSGAWTRNIEAADGFESIAQALRVVRRRRLRDMELVLTELPARIGDVPFPCVSLEQLLARQALSPEPPRRPVRLATGRTTQAFSASHKCRPTARHKKPALPLSVPGSSPGGMNPPPARPNS